MFLIFDNLYMLLMVGFLLRIYCFFVLIFCFVFILVLYYFFGWSLFFIIFFIYYIWILEEFVRDNDFEVFDVFVDGNCMFCFVEDQLWINV